MKPTLKLSVRRFSIPLILAAFPAIPAQAQFEEFLALAKKERAAVVDYDKDGFVDIINGRDVYHNARGSTFRYQNSVPGSPREGGGSGGAPTAWADFDGDGVRDVMVLGTNDWSAPLRDRIRKVSISNGVPSYGTYHDIVGYDVDWTGWDCSYPSGTEVQGYNQNATWGAALADVNRDGKVDLYLGRGRIGNSGDPNEYYGKDWLVLNQSTPSTLATLDISNSIGMSASNQKDGNSYRHSEGAGAADYDMDGYPDFFVGNYRGFDNYFWKGAAGGTHGFHFSNAGQQQGAQSSTGIDMDNSASSFVHHGGGVAWFDHDNDGDMDLIEARLHHYEGTSQQALRLWTNNADGTFTNQSSLLPGDAGAIGDGSYASGHYKGVATGDYDNDGDVDLYLTRSVQYYPPTPRQQLYSGWGYPYFYLDRGFGRMLRNDGGHFTDVTESLNLHNPAHMDVFAAAMLDFDSDGLLDLFTCQGWGTSDGKDELWRNGGNYPGHWLAVDLRPWENPGGITSFHEIEVNSDAIGAVVQIWIDKNSNGLTDSGELLTRMQQANTTGSMFIGPQPLHFGLGEYDQDDIKWLRVLWPGQKGLEANGEWSVNWHYFGVGGVDQRIVVSLPEPSALALCLGMLTMLVFKFRSQRHL